MKPDWLKDTIAKEDGYYAQDGTRLVARALSPERIQEWNADIEVDVLDETIIEVEEKPLDKMTKSELVEFAKENDIEVNVKDKKTLFTI